MIGLWLPTDWNCTKVARIPFLPLLLLFGVCSRVFQSTVATVKNQSTTRHWLMHKERERKKQKKKQRGGFAGNGRERFCPDVGRTPGGGYLRSFLLFWPAAYTCCLYQPKKEKKKERKRNLSSTEIFFRAHHIPNYRFTVALAVYMRR